MTPGTIIAVATAIALIGTGILYIRDRLKSRENTANDNGDGEEVIHLGSMWEVRAPAVDADNDEYLAALCRRVGRGSSFHETGK